jgi:hypothetical protein
MTREEQQQIADRQAARAAVLAKFPHGDQVISDSDCRYLSADEVIAVINSGRLDGCGPDRRLRGRS